MAIVIEAIFNMLVFNIVFHRAQKIFCKKNTKDLLLILNYPERMGCLERRGESIEKFSRHVPHGDSN